MNVTCIKFFIFRFISVKLPLEPSRSQHLYKAPRFGLSYEIFRGEGSFPVSTGGTFLGSVDFFHDFFQQFNSFGSF